LLAFNEPENWGGALGWGERTGSIGERTDSIGEQKWRVGSKGGYDMGLENIFISFFYFSLFLFFIIFIFHYFYLLSFVFAVYFCVCVV
jgi:hypothetical protein